ncbi:MAG TPA: type I DNA topoisomerase [Candidatus Tectomicrobia bacterium]|nr:type I DNA topoisomerase [Candidatus Tectomicrobia bacterium]
MADLVIVESPAKAKTIEKILGKGYTVKASVGHVRDLPPKRLGVNLRDGFTPEYIVIRGKAKVLDELRASAKRAGKIYLAPDPDREGEAIAWHIAQELDGKRQDTIYRVLFNEITPRAIAAAMRNPGRIDEAKVNAQQARRILDRLVGYQISPLLWRKVRRGLSAGRVQSVALRLICEREKEIEAFVPQEYWTVTVVLEGDQPPSFEAQLVKVGGKKAQIQTGEVAQAIAAQLRTAQFVVGEVKTRERKRQPPAPFITSRLQQEGANRLRFSARKTMTLAQSLYEGLAIGPDGVVGLITYMRTDSTRVSAEAQAETLEFINTTYGQHYAPEKPNVYRSKKSAQDAHEAIRPTSTLRTPDQIHAYLDRDHQALYHLIWARFVASQMRPAIFDITTADVTAGEFGLRASGSVLKFDGFLKVYTEDRPTTGARDDEEADQNRALPPLHAGQVLRVVDVKPEQHFTQPPPRYTEASLVAELEKRGIGRPSTYATILSIIQDRDYVETKERKFYPTELGRLVSDLLVEHFPDVMDIEFTAAMEDLLDQVEEGRKPWVGVLREFYEPFEKHLQAASQRMPSVKKMVEPTTEVCEKCGKPMVIRLGRYGKFLACSGYPDCKATRPLKAEEPQASPIGALTSEVCEQCGSPMVVRKGRYGEFLACSAYPACKVAKPMRLGVACPTAGCTGELVQRRTKRGRAFYGCNRYPDCQYTLWSKPVPMPCPECQAPFLVEQGNARKGKFLRCLRDGCGYESSVEIKNSAEG